MAATILHIGMHKTGSTSIQAAFNGFRARGVRYADLGHENHSIPIWTVFSGEHLTYHIWAAERLGPEQIEARRREFLTQLNSYFRTHARDTIILSGEDISLLPETSIPALAEVIGVGGREVKVVVYVREAVSFCQSELQQQIKAGYTTADLYPPMYRFRIEKFQRTFGRDNVIVREFAPDKLAGGDVVEDFARIVGVPAPRKGVEANTSLSIEAARVLFLLNHFVAAHWEKPAIIEARDQMMAHMAGLLPGRFAIPPDLIGGIYDPDDVLWLKEATGVDFTSSAPAADVPHDSAAMRLFLSQVAPETLDTLRRHLAANCGVPSPPQEPYFLLARYFMSFLQG